jgi:hypothetical protein
MTSHLNEMGNFLLTPPKSACGKLPPLAHSFSDARFPGACQLPVADSLAQVPGIQRNSTNNPDAQTHLTVK